MANSWKPRLVVIDRERDRRIEWPDGDAGPSGGYAKVSVASTGDFVHTFRLDNFGREWPSVLVFVSAIEDVVARHPHVLGHPEEGAPDA